MEIDISDVSLTDTEKMGVVGLLSRQNFGIQDDLTQMWYLMDLIWDEFGCDNGNLDWESINRFYSHPVWLLNGLYIEQDEVSMGHRNAISDWVIASGFTNIVDYGGGFGTLARLVANQNSRAVVDIYEPHPSEFGLRRAEEYSNIHLVDVLKGEYECLLSTDVLEHVDDPLKDFSLMIDRVQMGGYLVVANCFQPVIKCHLPQNFHFRFTFNILSRLMGLEVKGVLEGSHATTFQKTNARRVHWKVLRAIEFASKISFPLINAVLPILRPIKRLVD